MAFVLNISMYLACYETVIVLELRLKSTHFPGRLFLFLVSHSLSLSLPLSLSLSVVDGGCLAVVIRTGDATLIGTMVELTYVLNHWHIIKIVMLL